MSPRLVSKESLQGISAWVEEQVGLDFSGDRLRNLAHSLGNAAKELGFDNVRSLASEILGGEFDSQKTASLVPYLTIGESYFFRDKALFDALASQILPECLRRARQAGRPLRLWSAGCATGEEPYSLAILVSRLRQAAGWPVFILATDLNPRFLGRAAEAHYTAWSFRESPAWLQKGYFERRADGRFTLQEEIRKRVVFQSLNLVDDVFPAQTRAMDLVLCRNVLMYFSERQARSVADRFHACLAGGGYLVVSAAESSPRLFPRFSVHRRGGVILFRSDPGRDNEAPPGVAATSTSRNDSAPEPTPSKPQAADTPRVPRSRLALPARAVSPRGGEGQAVESSPDTGGRAATLAAEARRSADLGRLAEAAGWCARAIEADGMNPGLRYLLAAILLEQDDLTGARAALRQALYLDPGFVLAHVALGHLELRRGRPEAAGRHFRAGRALLRRSRPEDPLPDADGLTAGVLLEELRRLAAPENPEVHHG